MSKIKIKFCGGVNTATGANFFINIGKRNILIDCGMYQGEKFAEKENREDFDFNPKEIDFLFITHAHLDHVGRIPKLVKDGFKGIIYSTSATKDMAEFILKDSLHILRSEWEKYGEEPIFEEADIEKSMNLWKGVDYHNIITIESGDEDIGDIKVEIFDAGHILGSSMICMMIKNKKFLWTGDLGNSPSPLLKDTEEVENVDYLFMESVYGNRNHEHRDERINLFKNLVKKTILQKGVLMIPAFAIERTQEIIYIFNQMIEKKEIPLIPVYLDSPLGIKITEVYKKYEKDFNENVEKIIHKGEDIFSFAGLHISESKEESKAINESPNPKIIIAGSGMSNGGRIIHHEARYLSGKNNILLFAGYQAVGTLGRKILERQNNIFINHKKIEINAEIIEISGFSGHKDSDNLFKFVADKAKTLKKVFVLMGEPKSQNFLAQKIHNLLEIDAEVPNLGDEIEINI